MAASLESKLKELEEIVGRIPDGAQAVQDEAFRKLEEISEEKVDMAVLTAQYRPGKMLAGLLRRACEHVPEERRKQLPLYKKGQHIRTAWKLVALSGGASGGGGSGTAGAAASAAGAPAGGERRRKRDGDLAEASSSSSSSSSASAGTKRPRQAAGRQQPTKSYSSRFAITFGEVSILHVGGVELGAGRRETGFSVAHLREVCDQVRAMGFQAELVDVSAPLERHGAAVRAENEAATLVIRNGAALFEEAAAGASSSSSSSAADALYAEQRDRVRYDRKYYDAKQKKTKNKRARFNVVFGEEAAQANDDFTQYTVAAFSSLPRLAAFREAMPRWLGPGAARLNAEGNHYYEDKSGIGFHGDAERKVVVCLSLGKTSVLRYQWRLPGSSEHLHDPVDISVGHGDVYVMSEKATGWDWRLRSKIRVVHAAGAKSYTEAKARSASKAKAQKENGAGGGGGAAGGASE